MTDYRIHRAVSVDGTQVVGRVQGNGPPLILVHSPVHDGDIAWEQLLPFLTDRFTCYTPSLRGRGLSGDSPDGSSPRSHFQEDVNSVVDSVEGPSYLMGWSDGCGLALGSAANSDTVAAVVAFEPGIWHLMGEDDAARFGATVKQWSEATAEGRLLDAARAFHHFVCNDDELNALGEDYLRRQARLFPLLMRELQEGISGEGPQPIDPEVFSRIDVPVLVLSAQRTELSTWFAASAQHVKQQITHALLREVPGVGHFAPLVAPQPLAEEVISFFESVQSPGQ